MSRSSRSPTQSRPGIALMAVTKHRPLMACVIAFLLTCLFAQTAAAGTANFFCYWHGATYPSMTSNGNYYFVTNETTSYTFQGLKASMTLPGRAHVNDPSWEHVNSKLTALEDYSTCNKQPLQFGCWIQTGWIYGAQPLCPTGTTPVLSIQVYAEVYDDTGPYWCYTGLYGTPPAVASYDTRFYAVANGLYRYQIYYQAPGGSIQVLAFGDFRSRTTEAVAGGEAITASDVTPYPECAQLSDTTVSPTLATIGAPSSTFAGPLQLWNGSSWINWTRSAAPSSSLKTKAPYTLQWVSNYGAGDMTQFKVGGPQ